MNPSNLPQVSSITDAVTKANYEPPGAQDSTLFGHHHPIPPNKAVDYVHNPTDGSVLLDHKGRPVTVDKLLATKPLRNELSTRPGPGNKKLTYISGEGVSRTLNDIFGFDGWNLDIQDTQQVEMKQLHGKYHVVYTAQVRLTHKNSGAYKEDCGAGDSADKSLAIAVAHALKASITDAMKRAARHFGDKLGNCKFISCYFQSPDITMCS
jgi:DNA repair and recombination protein RAD52